MKIPLMCVVILSASACGVDSIDPGVAGSTAEAAVRGRHRAGGGGEDEGEHSRPGTVKSSSAPACTPGEDAERGDDDGKGRPCHNGNPGGGSSQGTVVSSAMGTASSMRPPSSAQPPPSSRSPASSIATVSSRSPASSRGTASSAGTASSTGPACSPVGYAQVSPIISAHCISCHPGQSVALTSYTSGLAPANNGSCAGMNLWECSSLRMGNGSMPPGGGGLTAADKNTMAGWIALGFPQNSCAADAGVVTPPAPPDAGSPPPAPPDAGPPPPPVPTCSTNSRWTSGDTPSSAMHPGWDCIHCHTDQGRASGQDYTAAGTVQGAIRDDNDCNGISAVSVSITDRNGTVSTQTTNSAGNFRFSTAFAYPVHISITKGGVTRTMSTPVSPPAGQTGIRCASCHTIAGAQGAPGRIIP